MRKPKDPEGYSFEELQEMLYTGEISCQVFTHAMMQMYGKEKIKNCLHDQISSYFGKDVLTRHDPSYERLKEVLFNPKKEKNQ